jgi:excinuclease ABC subunit C
MSGPETEHPPTEPSEPEALRERIANLPTGPGVYLFRAADDAVLYVGKAQNLRGRVRSYFNQGGDGRLQVHFLVPRIADVEVVATGNVKEALLLENQLIKKHKPRFNVRLRDDKNYLGLRLDPDETYARFIETRRFLQDGAVYFGPYTSSQSLRRTLSSLQRIFPLRTCSDGVFKSYQRRGRPCLEHSVGRCVGPCCGLVDDETYGQLVDGAVRFMKGQTNELVRDLEQRMSDAASSEQFEEAGRLRDRIDSIERTVERQSMISTSFADRDVFAVAREGRRIEIEVLHIRAGKLLGGNAHSFGDVRIPDAEALDSFLSQFYAGDRDLPREVLLPFAVEGREALEALWRDRAGRAVRISVPQRGERRRLVELAERNAELALAERSRREQTAQESLRDVAILLGLPRPPRRVECYDTSHLQGDLHVASRVVFENGAPAKDGYRRYKLREAAPGDDYGAMREVLRRRLERLDTDPAPDLLLLDGGKGQLNVVRALLADLNVEDIALASLAKERDEEAASPRVRRHGGTKREKLFLPGVKDPLLPAPDSPGLLFLQRMRDESHRFAIRYHRELRRKLSTRSILDELPGIGPVKRRALLRTLGSLERIKKASAEDLAAVPKITRADAERIVRFFAGEPVKAEPQSADSTGEDAQ